MTGRERFLTALSNGKPDRLPCQVHNFMGYYLNTYLKGMDAYQAYEYLGIDPVIYECPEYKFSDNDLKNWVYGYKETGTDSDGVTGFEITYTTPGGVLTTKGARNKFTSWDTEHLIKDERDMEIFLKYYPVSIGVDWTRVINAKNKLGDKGIVRTWVNNYGQPGIWQSFAHLIGTENAIFKAMDEPDWTHDVLAKLTEKSLKQIQSMGKIEADLVENGGGGASCTVISPSMHREFALPYDKVMHEALQAGGTKVVYHLCGGVMKVLDCVKENGTNALETMTPQTMGGDCNFEMAVKIAGDKLCFIGGLDQNQAFERGDKVYMRTAIESMFKAKPSGGFIISPSDHFFFGQEENLKLFAQIVKECRY